MKQRLYTVRVNDLDGNFKSVHYRDFINIYLSSLLESRQPKWVTVFDRAGNKVMEVKTYG